MQEIIRYQEIDAQLIKLERELATNVNRKNASEMQQFLKDGQARLIKLEELSGNLANQYNKAIALYNEFVKKLETLQKNVEAAKEDKLPELEETLRSFNDTAASLENNIAALANRMASANKEFENIMTNAKKAKHNLEIYKANYLKEKSAIDPEINKLKEQLAEQKTKVDAKILAKYNAKKEGRIFPIFVKETSGRCGGCRMEIPAAKMSDLKAKGIIECENCGRFIYQDK